MKTVSIPKLSTPGKIDLARAALANDLPLMAQLIAAIPGDPSARGTTKYYATRFLAWFEDQSGPLYFSVFELSTVPTPDKIFHPKYNSSKEVNVLNRFSEYLGVSCCAITTCAIIY